MYSGQGEKTLNLLSQECNPRVLQAVEDESENPLRSFVAHLTAAFEFGGHNTKMHGR